MVDASSIRRTVAATICCKHTFHSSDGQDDECYKCPELLSFLWCWIYSPETCKKLINSIMKLTRCKPTTTRSFNAVPQHQPWNATTERLANTWKSQRNGQTDKPTDWLSDGHVKSSVQQSSLINRSFHVGCSRSNNTCPSFLSFKVSIHKKKSYWVMCY